MLDLVIQAREAAIGQSLKVKRILSFRLRRMMGLYILMVHAGPAVDVPDDTSSWMYPTA